MFGCACVHAEIAHLPLNRRFGSILSPTKNGRIGGLGALNYPSDGREAGYPLALLGGCKIYHSVFCEVSASCHWNPEQIAFPATFSRIPVLVICNQVYTVIDFGIKQMATLVKR